MESLLSLLEGLPSWPDDLLDLAATEWKIRKADAQLLLSVVGIEPGGSPNPLVVGYKNRSVNVRVQGWPFGLTEMQKILVQGIQRQIQQMEHDEYKAFLMDAPAGWKVGEDRSFPSWEKGKTIISLPEVNSWNSTVSVTGITAKNFIQLARHLDLGE